MTLPFGIRNDEGLLVGLLWIQSLFIGLCIVAYESAATSLFLNAFEVSSLPLVYIGVSIISVILGFGYLTLEKKLIPTQLYTTTMIVILTGIIGARVIIEISDSKWTYLATMIWLDVGIIFLGLQFWSLSGLLFNVRQSKRLFGIIGSGEVVGVVAGGFGMPMLVQTIGTPNVFLWAAGCLGVAFVILTWTISINKKKLSEPVETEQEEEELSLGTMLKMPYLSQFFIFTFFVVLSDYFVDFFFYSKVDETFPDENKLASFLGPFFAIVGGFSFFAKIFLFNRIMKKQGIFGGLITLPVSVFISILLSMIMYYMYPDMKIAGFSGFFIFIMMTKFLDLGFRPSILQPTISLLYQPFPSARRVRVEAFTQSVIEPLANGLTGAVLLLLSMGLKWGSIEIAWTTIFILIIWSFIGFKIRKSYSVQLTKTFEKRKLVNSNSTDQQFDIAMLRPHLSSSEPGEVIYVLRLLAADSHYENIENELINFIDHPKKEVVIEALNLMQENGNELCAKRVEKLLLKKIHDEQILCSAIMTLCSLRESEAVEIVIPFIYHPKNNVSKSAIVGLVKHGGIAGILAAGRQLETIISSKDPDQRYNATQILLDIDIPSFYQPIVDLLEDESRMVQRGAIRCAASLANPKLIPSLIERLADPNSRAEVVNALSKFNPQVIGDLIKYFKTATENIRIRTGLAQAIGKIGGPEAMAFLISQLSIKDLDMRNVVCESLSNRKILVSENYRKTVIDQIRMELKLVKQNQVKEDISKKSRLAARAVKLESDNSFHRTFNLMSLLGFSDSIFQAKTLFFLNSETHRAIAIEILDNHLKGELRREVSEVFDAVMTGYGEKSLDLSNWLKRPEEELGDFVRSALIWTATSNEIKKLKPLLKSYIHHPSPILAEAVRFRIKPGKKTLPHELIMGKVELLSNLPIFHGAIIQELSELATSIKIRNIAKGKILVRQGDRGTSLFVIVEGQMNVIINKKISAQLFKGAVIGELAALDPEPRVATVRAAQDSIVYELEGDDLLDYMSQRIEVAKGIFHALCTNIRGTLKTSAPVAPPENLVSFENRPAPKESGFPLFEKHMMLSRVPFFHDLPETTLNEISHCLIVKYANPGEIIIHSGDVGESLFVLVDGEVVVHHGQKQIAKLHKGAVFGELSALDPEPRSATITAIGEVTVFQISGKALYELMTTSPELIKKITKVLTKILRTSITKSNSG